MGAVLVVSAVGEGASAVEAETSAVEEELVGLEEGAGLWCSCGTAGVGTDDMGSEDLTAGLTSEAASCPDGSC